MVACWQIFCFMSLAAPNEGQLVVCSVCVVNSNVDSGSENSCESASAAGDDLSSQEGQGRGHFSKRVKRKLTTAEGK